MNTPSSWLITKPEQKGTLSSKPHKADKRVLLRTTSRYRDLYTNVGCLKMFCFNWVKVWVPSTQAQPPFYKFCSTAILTKHARKKLNSTRPKSVLDPPYVRGKKNTKILECQELCTSFFLVEWKGFSFCIAVALNDHRHFSTHLIYSLLIPSLPEGLLHVKKIKI